MLNARTDTYFAGTTGDASAETVERAVRYVEAGADCVFVPGVVEEGTIRRLAAAVPGPLNVVAGLANIIDALVAVLVRQRHRQLFEVHRTQVDHLRSRHTIDAS